MWNYRKIKCPECGHEWFYKGVMSKTRCANCGKNLYIKDNLIEDKI